MNEVKRRMIDADALIRELQGWASATDDNNRSDTLHWTARLVDKMAKTQAERAKDSEARW